MFCPLCKSEYREGVARCINCGAPLVDSLERLRDNPAALLWIGKNEAEFSAIVDALRENQIPALVQEQPRAALGNRLRPDSQIHVLQSDLKRALQIAATSTGLLPRTSQHVRTCHGCGSEARASFTHCPRCGTMLIASTDSASPDSEPIARADLLVCPICNAEYRSDHTHCTLCGVDLVPERLRNKPFDENLRSEELQLVWRGGDPVAVSRAIAALRGARIPHHVKPTQDHMAFELGIPRPRYEVRVFASDADPARRLLNSITESLPFASFTEPLESEIAGPSAAQSVARRGSPQALQAASHTRWKPQQATREIWSSDDSALAQILEDCLSENSIGVRVEGTAPGTLRLFVRPQEEAGAREIIREVLEGVPPK
jgi:rRNA maturation endonuclease Nob1